MAENEGNGNGNGFVNLDEMTWEGVRKLFPNTGTGPIVSGLIDSGNPGTRLVANDDKLIDMLKIVYVEDYEMARNVAEALAECDEFLLGPDGKPDTLVLQRVEWIKYMLAIFCSVKGRFADAYKQAATGVLTNAMSDARGWTLLNMPLSRNGAQNPNESERPNHNNKRP